MADLDDVLAHAHDNCVACEGTGVVRCWSPGGPCPDGQTVCESCGPCQQSDVPALVALVRAKESWIDGAKVDMAAMEESLCGFSEEWHSRIIAERNEARAEAQKATAWHMEALDDLSACAAERDDLRRRYEALRDGVTGLCEQADRSHDEYLRGLILDRFIVPSNVTVSRIRAVVARVEET